MVARIYRRSSSAMQSGRGKQCWVLDYAPETPKRVDSLMGYTSSDDMNSQIRLEFPTRDAAIRYADREGIDYRVVLSGVELPRRRISYSDNFAYDRKFPWTH